LALRRFAFTVNDTPKPAARPRFARRGDKVFTYIPSGDQENRNSIRDAFLSLIATDNPLLQPPLEGPLRLTVTAWLPMPASIPKKRRDTALPTKRPDLDNFVKQVEDALNHYAFVDDAQIVTIIARKRYIGTLRDNGFVPGLSTARITSPCWEVCLEEIEG
jgi:Holliday junction resolvase RusA-like endonuclease